MRYSNESRDRIYVKDYGFLTFAKNIGKSVSGKYEQTAQKRQQGMYSKLPQKGQSKKR